MHLSIKAKIWFLLNIFNRGSVVSTLHPALSLSNFFYWLDWLDTRALRFFCLHSRFLVNKADPICLSFNTINSLIFKVELSTVIKYKIVCES